MRQEAPQESEQAPVGVSMTAGNPVFIIPAKIKGYFFSGDANLTPDNYEEGCNLTTKVQKRDFINAYLENTIELDEVPVELITSYVSDLGLNPMAGIIDYDRGVVTVIPPIDPSEINSDYPQPIKDRG